jgi:hypothetical protein
MVRRRSYIKEEQVKELAKDKHNKNGLGITFVDVMSKFDVKKEEAQRKIKHFRMKKVLFTAEDLAKQNAPLKGLKRENPQRYYLREMKSKMIESRKNNVQKDTTGIGQSIMPSTSFSSTIDELKASNLQEILTRLSSAILYIHNLQIWTCFDRKYYDDVDIKPEPVNKAKICEERINKAHGPPNLKFIVSSNGTVMIHIINSEHPFRLYSEQDVSDILVFLGRVQEKLSALFSDTTGSIVQPVRKWILKGCDVNKDIEIDAVAQITLHDMQIPLFEKALRGYVKPIDDKVYYRFELILTQDEPIEIALERIRTQVKIDESIISLEQANKIP